MLLSGGELKAFLLRHLGGCLSQDESLRTPSLGPTFHVFPPLLSGSLPFLVGQPAPFWAGSPGKMNCKPTGWFQGCQDAMHISPPKPVPTPSFHRRREQHQCPALPIWALCSCVEAFKPEIFVHKEYTRNPKKVQRRKISSPSPKALFSQHD